MNKSTTHTTPNGYQVRVWHGREYVEGPDTRLRGWFWAVTDKTGEGDATGPFRTEAEAATSADAID